HNELEALGASQLNEFLTGELGEGIWVGLDLFQEVAVEFFVDEACAGTSQLVRHATGAEDSDLKVLRVGLHGLADGLAEFVAARCRRLRILEHVNQDWDDGAGPLLAWFRAVHRHGDSEAVVDFQLVEHGQVETLIDDFLGEESSEFWLSHGRRDRAHAPAFVRDVKAVAYADAKGVNYFEYHCIVVIVVYHAGVVRSLLRHTLLEQLVSVAERLQIRVSLQVAAMGGVDGRNVRGG